MNLYIIFITTTNKNNMWVMFRYTLASNHGKLELNVCSAFCIEMRQVCVVP